MVSTLDFESSDPSSNLGGTCFILFFLIQADVVAHFNQLTPLANKLVHHPLFLQVTEVILASLDLSTLETLGSIHSMILSTNFAPKMKNATF